MLVSIVIPAYNAKLFLAATVASVKSQTFQDWELVIVDDGSKDDTYQRACRLAEHDARIRVVQQANAGTSAARNTGFRCCSATSSFLLFLDNDDVLEPSALDVLLAALADNPEVVAAHGKLRCIDQDGNPIAAPDYEVGSHRAVVQGNRIVWELPNDRTSFQHLAASNVIVTPGLVLIRREHLEAVGEFDQNINNSSDWDMWLRLTRRGDIANVAKTTLAYRLHPFNESKKYKDMRNHEMACTLKAYGFIGNTPDQRRMIEIGYRAMHMRYSRSKFQIASGDLRKGRFNSAVWQCIYGIRHIIKSRKKLK